MNSPAVALRAVPNSSGTEPPRLKAPANSADCHIHIYDPRFQPPVAKPSNATMEDYRLLQKRIGVTRVVIVTPRNYATDNSVTVDAIRQLGPNARGVAVIRPSVTDGSCPSMVSSVRTASGAPWSGTPEPSCNSSRSDRPLGVSGTQRITRCPEAGGAAPSLRPWWT